MINHFAEDTLLPANTLCNMLAAYILCKPLEYTVCLSVYDVLRLTACLISELSVDCSVFFVCLWQRKEKDLFVVYFYFCFYFMFVGRATS